MCFRRFFKFSTFVCAWILLLGANAVAQSTANPFSVSSELRPRVDFWKTIFSKYGEFQMVFHHRQHPGIIYSVLDLEDLNEQWGRSREFEIRKARAENAEEKRIKEMLLYLGNGGEPRDNQELRVLELFQAYSGKTSGWGLRRALRAATEDDSIRSQTGIKDRFQEGVIRASRYLYAMEKIFRDEGIPAELTRIPLIESSFNYEAYSSVGAAGIWQFMRKTGSQYMRISASIDERRDPIVASRAAAKYLSHAYDVLGAWPLAITSYNHGINGVLKASKSVGSKRIENIIRDYDSETFGFASKNFYVEFLAAMEIEREPERYFPGIKRERPWYFDEVQLSHPARYLEVARKSGTTLEEFQEMNLSLLQPVRTGRVPIPAGFTIKVHRGNSAPLIAAINNGEITRFSASLEKSRMQAEAKSKTSNRKTAKKGPNKRKQKQASKNRATIAKKVKSKTTKQTTTKH